jgi:hypothetical protein
MAGKLERLLSDFEFTTLSAVYGEAKSQPLRAQAVHT